MAATGYTVRTADWNTDREAIRAVRQAVFVVEQGIPETLEWDAADPLCRHWLALDADGHAIATARLKPDGQIGRMAVLEAWRGKGVGSTLLGRILADVPPRLWLNAQATVVDFYRARGFRPSGPPFSDAGIPHRKMVYSGPAADQRAGRST